MNGGLGLYPLLRMSFALGSFAYANLVLLSLAAAALLFPLRLSREERAGTIHTRLLDRHFSDLSAVRSRAYQS